MLRSTAIGATGSCNALAQCDTCLRTPAIPPSWQNAKGCNRAFGEGIAVTRKCSYRPQTPKKDKKCDSKVTVGVPAKVTQKLLKSDSKVVFSTVLVTFESLWPGPRKSLLSRSLVFFLGGGLQEHFRVTRLLCDRGAIHEHVMRLLDAIGYSAIGGPKPPEPQRFRACETLAFRISHRTVTLVQN